MARIVREFGGGGARSTTVAQGYQGQNTSDYKGFHITVIQAQVDSQYKSLTHTYMYIYICTFLYLVIRRH